jgi:hypothetical protein
MFPFFRVKISVSLVGFPFPLKGANVRGTVPCPAFAIKIQWMNGPGTGITGINGRRVFVKPEVEFERGNKAWSSFCYAIIKNPRKVVTERVVNPYK